MNTWVALLRGINVGGKNLLKMRELVELLEGIGYTGAKTYVQSGNAVFKSSESKAVKIGAAIESALRENRGVDARVLVLGKEELGQAITASPFQQAEKDPNTLHLFFLSEPPRAPDIDSLKTHRADSESFVLADRVFYLHAPDGFGRSKLGARVERLLGVDATVRNWRTVTTLLQMASELD